MAPKILSALDTAKTQYYHFKAIIIAGMGMFTDAYDLFCIPPIMTLIGRIYYDDNDIPTSDNDRDHHHRLYEVTPAVASTMMGIALLGTAIGQLVFGRLGDRKGRRKVYGIALMIMVFSSIGCGFSVCTSSRTCVLLSLGFFRFLLGLGIGGDYPLSATIMSEYANKNTRGGFIAAVFSMQGFGILVSSFVTMVVCAVFNRASNFPPAPNDGGDHHHHHTPEAADLAWRLILMIGAIPAALTFYWRISMPETPRYTALVEKNVLQATKDMQKVLDMSPMVMSTIPEEEIEDFSPSSLSAPLPYTLCSKEFFRRHGRDLFACSISWFLVDIVFYSSNLFQSHIYKQFLPDPKTVNAYEHAFCVAKLQAIVAACSTIPGYFATVYFIDRIGRVKIQMLGFFSVAICLFAIGIPYSSYWNDEDDKGNGKINITDIGFMILYGLTFFFSNFGPNTTTFIIPAELFPARFRSTCHGISGAVGKIGAIIGSVGFLWASQPHDHEIIGYRKGIGMTASLMLLAAVSMLGVITTFLFTRETKGRSLEDNENNYEDQSSATASGFIVRSFKDCIRRPRNVYSQQELQCMN